MFLPRNSCSGDFHPFTRKLLILATLACFSSSARADSVTATPPSLAFGNVAVKSRLTLPVVLTNNSNATVTISRGKIQGSVFSTRVKLPIVLPPGGSFTVSITFAPRAVETYSGQLAGSNASGTVVVVPLSGAGVTAGVLGANPASLDFGAVPVGQNKALYETLTNGGGANVTISQANVSDTGFRIIGLDPPVTLSAGQNYTFTVKFAPLAGGNANGRVTVVSDASNPSLPIPLTGSGIAAGQLSVSPAALNFGDVVVGRNANLVGQLQATGAAVTVTSANVAGVGFSLSGLTFPFTLQPGNSAQFTVVFAPQDVGVASGSATFNSDAANSPTIETLTGNGTAPPQHKVVLSWIASGSQNVIGYNIYRANTSGGPYSRVNSAVDQETTYTDGSVACGQTYYYTIRAVDGNNQESSNSNESPAVIPPG